MLKSLTKKEREILEFVRVSSQIHGYSPSLLEIRDHFRLSAVSTVHEHISNLKKKGYILKEVSQARSIKVIDTQLEDQEFLEIPINFELVADSRLVESPGRDSVYVHKSSLNEEGRYFALKIKNDLYANNSINQSDILVIKEAEKLPFNTKALIAMGNNVFIGEIIEHKQLPAFKKFTPEGAVLLKFSIKGEVVYLIRNYCLSLK